MGILDQPVARVLVLGVGNVLLGDDGVGPCWCVKSRACTGVWQR